jgi:hypothetical protein
MLEKGKESILILILGIMLFLFGSVYAAEVSRIEVNNTFITVNISGAEELYAYEVGFNFTGITNGVDNDQFLGSSGTTYGYNVKSFLLSVYGSKQGQVAGVNGSGGMFNVTHEGGISLWYLLTINSSGYEEYVYYNDSYPGDPYLPGSNEAPDTPTNLVINTTTGLNLSSEDLYCWGNISDDGISVDVQVNWYNNSVLDSQVIYQDVAVGGLYGALLDAGNTIKGDNWSCQMRLDDGYLFSDWSALSLNNITIENSLPVVYLTSPENGNITTDRTPTFEWAAATDSDNDAITNYEFNLSLVPASLCNEEDRNLEVGVVTQYTLLSDLICFYNDNDTYMWSVRARDADGYGEWAAYRTINVSVLHDFSLVTDSINFGSLAPNVSVNTTAGYSPIVLQNDGNVFLNITLSGTQLWDSVAFPSEYYQFKIDNYTGHEGAFNWASSITDWENISSSAVTAVVELNHSTWKRAEVDILAWVPSSEHSAVRNSSITLMSTVAY